MVNLSIVAEEGKKERGGGGCWGGWGGRAKEEKLQKKSSRRDREGALCGGMGCVGGCVRGVWCFFLEQEAEPPQMT